MSSEPNTPSRTNARQYGRQGASSLDRLFTIPAVKIGIGLLLSTMTVILIANYHMSSEQDYRPVLSFAVTAIASSAAIASAVYALRGFNDGRASQLQIHEEQIQLQRELHFRQIEFHREIDRKDRAFRQIERWNTGELQLARQHAKRTNDFLRKIRDQSPEELDRQLADFFSKEENQACRQSILTLLNFLEEIALCIKKEFSDEDILRTFFVNIVHQYCSEFGTLIDQRRREDPSRFDSLRDLNAKWGSSTD